VVGQGGGGQTAGGFGGVVSTHSRGCGWVVCARSNHTQQQAGYAPITFATVCPKPPLLPHKPAHAATCAPPPHTHTHAPAAALLPHVPPTFPTRLPPVAAHAPAAALLPHVPPTFPTRLPPVAPSRTCCRAAAAGRPHQPVFAQVEEVVQGPCVPTPRCPQGRPHLPHLVGRWQRLRGQQRHQHQAQLVTR
jgi:hypothetical protein